MNDLIKRREERRVSKRLEPYGHMWWDFDNKLIMALSELPSEALKQLIADCETLNGTNCWYATFYAAPHIIKESKVILQQREKKPKEKS